MLVDNLDRLITHMLFLSLSLVFTRTRTHTHTRTHKHTHTRTTDGDGEQTKSFIVVMIQKGKETVVTTHEDKRHIYQEGDYVELREVEGMTEINGAGPFKITKTTKHTFTIDCDSSGFGEYKRQGVVENKKVAKPMEFHSWEQSYKNPAGSSQYGMLETPDLSKFGRSDQLHAALYGILSFLKSENRFPENTDEDVKKCTELANA